MAFIDLSALGLNTSQADLLDEWLAVMQAAYPGYVPSLANPEYRHALGIATIAADVAQTAVVVPDAIFRAYGTKLFGIVYEAGSLASATIQVTAVDSLGYTLNAGTSVTLNGFGFQTLNALTIPAASSVGTVTVVAAAPGIVYNGASNPVEILASGTIVNWVSSVTVLAPASGGMDPEDDSDYENRLASLFQLIAPRPITASDYAAMALSFIPAAGTDQQEIGRATAIDGYAQGAAAFTVNENSTTTLTVTAAPGTGITAAQGASVLGAGIPSATFTATTSSSVNPTVLTAVSSFTNVTVGALLSGTGIAAGAFVLGFNSGAGTVTMSAPATATNAGVTVTISTTIVQSSTPTTIVLSNAATATSSGVVISVGGTFGNQREQTVGIALADGTATNADTKIALAVWLKGFREVNFVVNVIDPTYTPVYVTVSVHLFAGFDPTATQAAIQAAITSYLSPAVFNQTVFGAGSSWTSGTVIYYENLVALVKSAGGSAVDHVVAGSLKLGLAATPTGVVDLVIPGPLALPTSSNSTVTVTVV